jgi:hypothetical protein
VEERGQRGKMAPFPAHTAGMHTTQEERRYNKPKERI